MKPSSRTTPSTYLEPPHPEAVAPDTPGAWKTGSHELARGLVLAGLYRTGRSRLRERRIVVGKGDVEGLLFGQQHILTQDFFSSRGGAYHTVPVAETPHFDFISSNGTNESAYLSYLECSWAYLRPQSNTSLERRARVGRFLDLFSAVASAQRVHQPVRLFQRPDGRWVILDGNHRAAIALELGLDLPAIVVSPRDALRSIARHSGHRNGSKWIDKPPQSLIHAGREIVRGFRSDTQEIIASIRSDDLLGASLLDLGCSIGARCYAAVESGASSAHGLELDTRSASTAVRLNSFFAAPCSFTAHDLKRPYIARQYDLVICVGGASRLLQSGQALETIRASTGAFLYFEGEPCSRPDDYVSLAGGTFSEIRQVGVAERNGRKAKRSPLYRCVVQR